MLSRAFCSVNWILFPSLAHLPFFSWYSFMMQTYHIRKQKWKDPFHSHFSFVLYVSLQKKHIRMKINSNQTWFTLFYLFGIPDEAVVEEEVKYMEYPVGIFKTFQEIFENCCHDFLSWVLRYKLGLSWRFYILDGLSYELILNLCFLHEHVATLKIKKYC